MEYSVRIVSEKTKKATVFEYKKLQDANDKLRECREWNENNPKDKTFAWLYSNNAVIDSVK